MKKGLLSVLAVAAVAALVGTPAFGQAKKVKIATEGAYAPWNFTDPSGKLAGFEVDLANDLCKRMNAQCEIVAQDWDGIIPALNAGKYDAIMAGMSITDKRKEVINFSTPYAATPAQFVVLKSSPLTKALPLDTKVYSLKTMTPETQKAIDAVKAAFKGKIVGVQVSTTHANFLETYLKGIAEVRPYKTTEQHDLDLTAGRIDAALASQAYWKPMLDKPEGKDMTIVGPGFVGGLFGTGVGVGIRKADAQLLSEFDKAIVAAGKDGTIQNLSMKWFKFNVTPQE
ncbi:MAG: transporter substrate-binding domain-containing protein [Alphaproteobacteria bacterium]|nr:transporter substrate-binding domain-containing protein [Alphaproteobacteria bacterium]